MFIVHYGVSSPFWWLILRTLLLSTFATPEWKVPDRRLNISLWVASFDWICFANLNKLMIWNRNDYISYFWNISKIRYYLIFLIFLVHSLSLHSGIIRGYNVEHMLGSFWMYKLYVQLWYTMDYKIPLCGRGCVLWITLILLPSTFQPGNAHGEIMKSLI